MPEKWTGRLIGEMHNHNVTYEELAAELGVTKPYISMILNGARKPAGIRKRMGTKYGVVKTQLSQRNWTAWLEIPYISYD